MKEFKGAIGTLEAGRAVFRTGKTEEGKDYKFVSARVRVYKDAKGELIDPRTLDDDAALAAAAAESHSVALDPLMWDAIASSATLLDKVYITGTLLIGENSNEDHYFTATVNGKTVLYGDFVNPRPCGLKPDTSFPCGKLPSWQQLPIDAK